jgi:hypothetical protein
VSPRELRLFMRHVEPEPMSGCWLWSGAVSDQGYGRRGADRAHRVMFTHFRGLISPGESE